jgi:hypothetical protein
MSSVRDEAGQQSTAGHPRKGNSYRSLWGSLEVTDAVSARRSGLTRYRLEIFPPGTDDVERRTLLRFRRCRLYGALAAIVGIFLVAGAWPGWQGPLYIAVTYFAGLFLGLRATSRLRRATRTLTVASMSMNGTVQVEGRLALLEDCLVEFDRIDEERARGALSPIFYELAWSALYERLDNSGVTSKS